MEGQGSLELQDISHVSIVVNYRKTTLTNRLGPLDKGATIRLSKWSTIEYLNSRISGTGRAMGSSPAGETRSSIDQGGSIDGREYSGSIRTGRRTWSDQYLWCWMKCWTARFVLFGLWGIRGMNLLLANSNSSLIDTLLRKHWEWLWNVSKQSIHRRIIMLIMSCPCSCEVSLHPRVLSSFLISQPFNVLFSAVATTFSRLR